MTSAMLNFSNQRIVITGAAGGVGQALVSVFKRLNAEIIAFDADEEGLAQLDVVSRYTFDLRDKEATRVAVQRTLASGPPPAAVISNAGWTRAESLDQIDDETFADEIEINLTTGATLSRAFLPAMRDRQGGAAFIFVSSVNAFAHYGNPAYAAAKAGLQAWMRAIATEEGRFGIRANAIAPGSIRTAAWDHRFERFPGLEGRISRLYPLRRMVRAEEVAAAAAFLASPLASGISGITLPVDAGLTASNLPFIHEIAPEIS